MIRWEKVGFSKIFPSFRVFCDHNMAAFQNFLSQVFPEIQLTQLFPFCRKWAEYLSTLAASVIETNGPTLTRVLDLFFQLTETEVVPYQECQTNVCLLQCVHYYIQLVPLIDREFIFSQGGPFRWACRWLIKKVSDLFGPIHSWRWTLHLPLNTFPGIISRY